jgi:hypothetical protein
VAAVRGTDVAGHDVVIEVGDAPILLLFLSLDCQGCDELFAAASAPTSLGLDRGRAVVVVSAGDCGKLAGKLGGAPHVLSPAAFSSYRVAGTPFFSLLVPGLATVATEGVAWGVAGVAETVQRALAGDPHVEVPRLDQ